MRNILLLLIPALTACGAWQITEPLAVASRSDGVPVELRELPAGAIVDPWTSDLPELRTVVRSPAEWEALWASSEPRYPVPPIDFREEMLLVAAAGQRGGHGNRIRIDSALVAERTLHAVVREYTGCATTGMIVTPVHVVRVDRTDLPVHFVERGTVRDSCP